MEPHNTWEGTKAPSFITLRENDNVSVDSEQHLEDEDQHHWSDLRQTLSEHHVNMIALSASIGFGLFLQNGRAISLAGPGLATLAYFLMGTVMWSCSASLGEMTALFPLKGTIFEFPRRFLDESVGYACGWMTWITWSVLATSELVAITHLFNFRFEPEKLQNAGYPEPTLEFGLHNTNSAVWVGLFLIIFFLINLLPARQFGVLEYYFGSAKIVFIVFLILFNVAISIRQPVHHDSNFWTYESPYAGAAQNVTMADGTVITGFGGRLGGMWECMTTAIFGMIGIETVSITAAENKDLRKEETIKLGTRKISLRVIVLYTLATFAVGLNVPYTDENIQDHSVIGVSRGQNSAFIVAAVLNHYRFWPYFFNAFFIFSAATCGLNSLWNSSRILHAMASMPGAWPDWSFAQSLRVRLERTRAGVPHTALFVSWLVCFIAFAAKVNDPDSAKALGRLVRVVIISSLIVYGAACASYLVFYKRIQAVASGMDEDFKDADPATLQAYDRNHRQYPYKSRAQWLRAAYGLTGCCMMTLFNGWRSLSHPFSPGDFVASYICIAIFALLIIAYQIKINGRNPRYWRRRACMDVRNPKPLVVLTRHRRGVLYLKDRDTFFTVANLKIFAEWIWVWLK